VAVRIPEFTCAADMKVRASGAAGRRSAAVRATPYGHYLQLGRHAAGAQLTVTYPLPVVREEIAVGNPGFRQYPYRVTWKGDTVVRLEPLGREVRTGYSEVEKRRVRVYFGKDGPGRLYRREHLLRKGSGGRPVASPIHLDSGSLDLWRIV